MILRGNLPKYIGRPQPRDVDSFTDGDGLGSVWDAVTGEAEDLGLGLNAPAPNGSGLGTPYSFDSR